MLRRKAHIIFYEDINDTAELIFHSLINKGEVNMMDMNNIQDIFNKSYNFDSLKEKTQEYIKNIIADGKNNFLSEEEDFIELDKLKNFIIQYNRTFLIINKCFRENPSFRLAFDLIDPDTDDTQYIYEVEYNILGELLDEYFLEV